jgi:GDP-mannose 4,6-dehydratase
MKILVTGANGMVASTLIDLLISKGHEVIGTKRWQEDDSNIKHIRDKIKLVDLNLNDLSNCIKVIEKETPDAISHLAAESYVSDSFDHPIESVHVNGIGTLNLLEAIRIVREMIGKEKILDSDIDDYIYNPIIHVCSSSEVYGLVKREDIPIKETQSFNPANPYACGKVLADVVARMYYTNYGLKTIVTRMFTHTSRRRKMLSAEVAFAKQIAQFEKHNKETGQFKKFILKHGNLNSLRTWAHAEDACEAYYQILTTATKFGETYNIGGLESREIGEMLDYMISLSPLKNFIEKQLDESLLRAHDVTLQFPDISKFQKDYPEWKAKWKFENIIEDVLEGQRENLK